MRIANREAYEWRREHREEVISQLRQFLEKVGRRGSAKSVDNATTGMVVFCSFLKMLPDEIAPYVKKHSVYSVLDDYVGWMVNECKFAPNSLRNHISVVKKFLALNDVEINNDKLRVKVDFPRYYSVTADRAPTPDELRKVLMHTNARGKSLITMLASSGMRIGELLSLRVKDVDFDKNPVTVHLKAEVTKDRQARYCFTSDESVTFLRAYLGDRISQKDACLFQGRHQGVNQEGKVYPRGEWENEPMSYWTADIIFSTALKHAGLEEKDDKGRDVIHIHCLRKFFFSQLVPSLGREVVEALMGHKRFLDAAYQRFTPEQMGEFYLKGMNAVTIMLMKQGMDEKAVVATFYRQYLSMAGYTDSEIDGMGNLSSYTSDQVRELSRQKSMKSLGLNGNHQKVVPINEVKQWIEQGWDFVTTLPDSEAIVRLPTR